MSRNSYVFLFLLTAIPLLLSRQSLSQPSNDDCDGAKLITELDNDCFLYPVADITYDLRNPTCANDTAKNFWFKFIAEGVNLNISPNTFQGPIAYIGLYQFTGANCNTMGMQEIACAQNEMIVSNVLTFGEEYYFSISYDTIPTSSVFLCVDNDLIGTDPPNDHICNSRPISYDSTCISGKLGNSTPDYPSPFCLNPPERTVWFNGSLPGNANGLEIAFDDININAEYSVHIYELNAGSCNNTPQNIYGFCGEDDTTFVYNNLSPFTDYYFMVSGESASGDGDFMICFDALVPPSGCALNNTCTEAHFIDIQTDSIKTCIDGCNTGASPGPIDTFHSCYNFPFETVWYNFTVEPTAQHLDIELTSFDMEYPHIGIFKEGCDSLIPVYCYLEQTHFLEIDLYHFEPGNYRMAVSDFSRNTGDFELCMRAYSDQRSCNYKAEVEVLETSLGSPPEGPFKSGEEVRFRYSIPQWYPASCNYLQGIVFAAGLGWDRTSFKVNSEPVKVHHAPEAISPGAWEWASDPVEYNFDNPERGIMEGTEMPLGWYFVEEGIADPDSSLGDGNSCADTSEMKWFIEFSLRVKPYPDCEPHDGMEDLSLLFQTFSDGEIGRNPVASCFEDKFTSVQYQMQCCEGIALSDASFSICSGSEFTYTIPGQAGLVEYKWVIDFSNGVSGATGGNQRVHSDILVNTHPEVRDVIYRIYGKDDQGCWGDAGIVTVTVSPGMEVNAGEDILACPGVTVALGDSVPVTGGRPPYVYEWSHGLGTDPNPEVIVTEDTVEYNLQVIDVTGCLANGSVRVMPVSVPGVETPQSTIYQCPEDTARVTLNFTGTPPYIYDIFRGINHYLRDTVHSNTVDYDIYVEDTLRFRLANLQDSLCVGNISDEFMLVAGDTSHSILNLNLCFDESVQIGDTTISSAGTYRLTLEGWNKYGCDSFVYADIAYRDLLYIDSVDIVDQRGSNPGSIYLEIEGGSPPYSVIWSSGDTGPHILGLIAGEYIANIQDSRGCEIIDTFYVDFISSLSPHYLVEKVRVYPQPVHLGQNVYFALDSDLQSEMKLRLIDQYGRTVVEDLKIQEGDHRVKWQTDRKGVLYWELYKAQGVSAKGKILVLGKD